MRNMLMHTENTIERVCYWGHFPGGTTGGLCNIAEFRHIKAMSLFVKSGTGIRGVQLYDPSRRQIIGEGIRICIYDKQTIHFLTGSLKDTLAIEDTSKKTKLRVRTSFPNPQHFSQYNRREIDLGHPNNEVISWAFTYFAILNNYQELFNTLVPIVYQSVFQQLLNNNVI